MVPACSCMMVCEIESPSPVPWGLVEKNGWNSFASTPRDMPAPPSVTRTCWNGTRSSSARGAAPSRLARSAARRPGPRGVGRRRTIRIS